MALGIVTLGFELPLFEVGGMDPQRQNVGVGGQTQVTPPLDGGHVVRGRFETARGGGAGRARDSARLKAAVTRTATSAAVASASCRAMSRWSVAARSAALVRPPSKSTWSSPMVVWKALVGSGWFSASRAKLPAVNWRAASCDPNTNTGSLPRCQRSATVIRGKNPARASSIPAAAASVPKRAARIDELPLRAAASASARVRGACAPLSRPFHQAGRR